jgi:hypothetical protein
VAASRKPQRISAVLPGVLKLVGARQETLAMVHRRWGRLVGRQLAAHTKLVGLQRGRLIVHVDQPGDGFALSFQRTRVLEELRRMTSGRVTELVIRP